LKKHFKLLKKNWGKVDEELGNREGEIKNRLRDFIFCEGDFSMRMKHPPCPLHKGDMKKSMKKSFTSFAST
jgi:hypothetical protein